MRYLTTSLRNTSGSLGQSPERLATLRFSGFEPSSVALILPIFLLAIKVLMILQTNSSKKSSRRTKAASRLRGQRRSSAARPKKSTVTTGSATLRHSETRLLPGSSLAAPTRGRSIFSMTLMVFISQALSITGAMKSTTSLRLSIWKKARRSSGARPAKPLTTFVRRLAASLTTLMTMACARLSRAQSSAFAIMRTSRVSRRDSSSGAGSFRSWMNALRRFAFTSANPRQSLYGSGWLPPPSIGLRNLRLAITRSRCTKASWAKPTASIRLNTCAIALAPTG